MSCMKVFIKVNGGTLTENVLGHKYPTKFQYPSSIFTVIFG